MEASAWLCECFVKLGPEQLEGIGAAGEGETSTAAWAGVHVVLDGAHSRQARGTL